MTDFQQVLVFWRGLSIFVRNFIQRVCTHEDMKTAKPTQPGLFWILIRPAYLERVRSIGFDKHGLVFANFNTDGVKIHSIGQMMLNKVRKMDVETKTVGTRDHWEPGPMNSDLTDGLFNEYAENRLRAELLMQQVYTRHIDMNSKLACELERLLERISGQDRKISMM
ncbi:MAG: hypothetical protein HW380_3725 [Magnetococcales bacterium]|nr:hypothetical protein [Magnetococcales bacterium]HIJ85562.1 hypothetical protein [Magnetococcales bacterium]